jgi:hypothetical protein
MGYITRLNNVFQHDGGLSVHINGASIALRIVATTGSVTIECLSPSIFALLLEFLIRNISSHCDVYKKLSET